MCDQLSSVGVEFDLDRMSSLFLADLRWSAAHPFPYVPSASNKHPQPWANEQLFPTTLSNAERDDKDADVALDAGTNDVRKLWETARPWSLGQTRSPESLLQKALGRSVRTPGSFMRVDADTNEATREPLVNTGEAVHSCVRVRLACGGLGLDDEELWTCKALTGDGESGRAWRLERSSEASIDDVHSVRSGVDESALKLYPVQETDHVWQWVCNDSASEGGQQTKVLPEAPLTGPCERLLLALTVGEQDVWKYADSKDEV